MAGEVGLGRVGFVLINEGHTIQRYHGLTSSPLSEDSVSQNERTVDSCS